MNTTDSRAALESDMRKLGEDLTRRLKNAGELSPEGIKCIAVAWSEAVIQRVSKNDMLARAAHDALVEGAECYWATTTMGYPVIYPK
jgi:hypothetical protein